MAIQDYYTARKDQLLKEFDGKNKLFRKVLNAHYGDQAETLMQATRREYEALIPQLPYVGGKANPFTWNLIGAAWFLALYKVLKAREIPIHEIGMVVSELMETWLKSYPRVLLRLMGIWFLSPFNLRRFRTYAQQSQQRRYPGDWVMTIVEEKGIRFGCDYSECAICKLFRAQGADELMPSMCAFDFVQMDAYGVKMQRTTTLGEGGAKCDFRYN